MKDEEFEKLKKKYRLSITQDFTEIITEDGDTRISLRELIDRFNNFLDTHGLEDAQLNIDLEQGYYHGDNASLNVYIFGRVNKTRSQLEEEIKTLQIKDEENRKFNMQENKKWKVKKEEYEKKEYARLKKKYGDK